MNEMIYLSVSGVMLKRTTVRISITKRRRSSTAYLGRRPQTLCEISHKSAPAMPGPLLWCYRRDITPPYASLRPLMLNLTEGRT